MQSMNPEEILLVLTNLPNRETAMTIARALIDGRFAACVTVPAGATSVYRWQGAVESADETPLLIKTTCARYPSLEAELRRLHPYELPEIIAVPLARGLPDYLQWVADETQVA